MKKLIVFLTFATVAFAAERFDYLVRSDFFEGIAGNEAAFARAMKLCEDTLAKDPAHAEAMVWHGSGQMVLAGKMFRKGDMQEGGRLWGQALKEMDAAGRIAPENNGVLIVRGATLLEAGKSLPDPRQAKALTARGVADYEKVREQQSPIFDKLSGHSRGELLFGLGSGYERLGQTEKARETFGALVLVGKTSGHLEEASEYLEKGVLTQRQMSCTGCHTGK